MKLIQRIGYYLGGFSLGLIILAFFFSKKKTSCSYGPEARVLKNINSKIRTYKYPTDLSDSILVAHILKSGNVNFSKSNPREEPCGRYIIEGEYNENYTEIMLLNCDSIVNILQIEK